MKVAFFEIRGWEKPILRRMLKRHKLVFFKEPLTLENALKARGIKIVSVFVYSKIDKELLNRVRGLKLIATRSTGFDHIDLKECKKRKISVYNIPSYGENTVAEHTFALILALSRKVHESHLRRLRGDFSIEGLKGFDLEGKTLGVVGVGRIGKHVVRIARGFEMNVLANDHHPDEFLAEQLDFKYVSLEELLKRSDIITLHIPYTKENHHIINKNTLKLVKKGAILINTSRGAIVDTAALIQGLDRQVLSGVGLDVLEGEELIKEEKQLLYDKRKVKALQVLAKDHILLARDNVVFTPHIAFYSKEALERIIEQTAENILAFIKGERISERMLC